METFPITATWKRSLSRSRRIRGTPPGKGQGLGQEAVFLLPPALRPTWKPFRASERFPRPLRHRKRFHVEPAVRPDPNPIDGETFLDRERRGNVLQSQRRRNVSLRPKGFRVAGASRARSVLPTWKRSANVSTSVDVGTFRKCFHVKKGFHVAPVGKTFPRQKVSTSWKRSVR